MMPIAANDVARLAGDDHTLRNALDGALRRSGYHYDIADDRWYHRPGSLEPTIHGWAGRPNVTLPRCQHVLEPAIFEPRQCARPATDRGFCVNHKAD